MLNRLPTSAVRRYPIVLALLFIGVLIFAACGQAARKTSTRPVSTTTPAPDSTGLPAVPGLLKIGVDREGLYEVSSVDIKHTMPGWENVDPNHLRLTLRGQEQPIWIMDQGEQFSVRFYGIPSDSRYTGENIYMLGGIHGNTHMMGEKQVPAADTSPAESFPATIRFEQNNLYAPQVIDGDHLFWLSLTGRKGQDFEVDLPKLDRGGGHLQIGVWGSTYSSVEPDHHLVISLNEQLLVDEKWDGSGNHTLEVDIPDGMLKNGKNVVVVEAPGDTGAAAEINYVDWIEFTYPRLSEADGDFLAFGIPAGMAASSLHLSKFTGSVSMIDVTVFTGTIRLTGITKEKEFIFTSEAGHRYLAIGPKGFSHPAYLTPAVYIPDLRAANMGGDYVIIVPQDLVEPLTPLVEWRAAHGLGVITVPLEAVYDQFNGGMPEPDAIRTFMIFASKAWNPAPRYLLLVGDATYDPRGYVSAPEANRLPVMFVHTSFGGETASDTLLGDVDGDMLPDLAVGRIPAQNADQVRILVNKTLAYEQYTPPGEWRLKILAIVDGQDASFQNDAQTFLDKITAPYIPAMYAPEAGVQDGPERVKAYFEDGYGLITYFGHGSINMWGKDRILMAEDVSSLANFDHLPVVINMTCLTGLFIHPQVTSLMETLLWHENGGAVAMLAPTSLTLPNSQSFLSHALIDMIMKNPGDTLGEIYLQAQREVPVEDLGAREVLLTFLLFGDPALQFSPK
jgi:hypothetical protein